MEHSIPEQAKKVINGLFQSHSGCPPARELALVHDGVLALYISPVFAGQRSGIARVFSLLVTSLYTGYIDRKMAFADASTYSPLYPLFHTAITVLKAHHLKHPGLYEPLVVYGSRQQAPSLGKGAPLAPLRQTGPTAASRKRPKNDDEYQEEEPASEVSRRPPSKRNKRAQTSSDPSG